MKLLIAGQLPLLRRGLRDLMRSRPEWLVAGEADTPSRLLELVRVRRDLDAVVLDQPFGEGTGPDLVAELRREAPHVPLVVLVPYSGAQYATAFLRAGANAFVRRNADADEVLHAITTVAQGGRYVTPGSNGDGRAPHELLSGRELEVFHLLASGRKPTEIATMLSLSVKTVSTYRARIFEKTGFRSNADLVGYAIRNRLV